MFTNIQETFGRSRQRHNWPCDASEISLQGSTDTHSSTGMKQLLPTILVMDCLSILWLLKWYLQLPLFLHTWNKHFSLHSVCSLLEMSNSNGRSIYLEIRAYTGMGLAPLWIFDDTHCIIHIVWKEMIMMIKYLFAVTSRINWVESLMSFIA